MIPIGLAGPIDIDAGTVSDGAYTAAAGFGAIDEAASSPFVDILTSCGSRPEDSLRIDPNGNVRYRFDHLLPGRFYHVDLVLYECGSGLGRTETVRVDGTAVSGTVNLGDGQVHRLSLLLDPALYEDGTVDVARWRTRIDSGPVRVAF